MTKKAKEIVRDTCKLGGYSHGVLSKEKGEKVGEKERKTSEGGDGDVEMSEGIEENIEENPALVHEFKEFGNISLRIPNPRSIDARAKKGLIKFKIVAVFSFSLLFSKSKTKKCGV